MPRGLAPKRFDVRKHSLSVSGNLSAHYSVALTRSLQDRLVMTASIRLHAIIQLLYMPRGLAPKRFDVRRHSLSVSGNLSAHYSVALTLLTRPPRYDRFGNMLAFAFAQAN